MEVKEQTLSVSAIREGTVIDHITCGQALRIILLLDLQKTRKQVTIGLNLTSQSYGQKDLIKVENYILSDKQTSDVAIFASSATINLISDFVVVHKIKASLPPTIEQVLICPNPKCVTRVEPVDTLFFVEEFRNSIHLRCQYCEGEFEQKEMHLKELSL